MAQILISVDPRLMSADALQMSLQTQLDERGIQAKFDLAEPDDPMRSVPLPIIGAAVKAVSSVLVGIIAALAGVAKGNAERKIIIQGKGGARVEVPADTSLDQIDHLVRQAKLLDVEVIKIGLV